MKTLKLKGSEVELEQTVADCNFCGEEGVECVGGSVPLSATYQEATYVGYREVVTKKDWVSPLFGKPYDKLVESEDKHIYEEGDWKVATDEADICHDCINQLAKLIK